MYPLTVCCNGTVFALCSNSHTVLRDHRCHIPGENKVQGDPFSDLTSEQKALQEDLMSSLHTSFIKFVEERRAGALKDPENSQVFTGKVWTGVDAVKVGLIDDVGTLHEVRLGLPPRLWGIECCACSCLSTAVATASCRHCTDT